MFDYSQLEAVYAVGKASSFSIAAQRLHITQSAVSQRIRLIEDQVGSPLVVRSSPPRLTKLGLRLAAVYEQIEAFCADIYKDLGAAKRVSLTLACNHESYHLWFSQCSAEIMKKYDVLIDLRLEDQDRTIELLRTSEVLGCVSSAATAVQGCKIHALGSMRYVCVARKEFIDQYKLRSRSKQSFLTAPTVVFGPFDRLQDAFLKQIFASGSAFQHNAHVIPSVAGMLDCITAGAAYGLLPEPLVRKLIDMGELVQLQQSTEIVVDLYWHQVQTQIPLLNEIAKDIFSAAKQAMA